MIGPLEGSNVTHDGSTGTYTLVLDISEHGWRSLRDGVVAIVELDRCGDRLHLKFTDLQGTVVPLPDDWWAWR